MTTEIEYEDGKYFINADSDFQVRKIIFTEAEDVQIPEILESFLEYRYGSVVDF